MRPWVSEFRILRSFKTLCNREPSRFQDIERPQLSVIIIPCVTAGLRSLRALKNRGCINRRRVMLKALVCLYYQTEACLPTTTLQYSCHTSYDLNTVRENREWLALSGSR